MNNRLPRLIIAVFALLGWYLSGAIHELGHAYAVGLAGEILLDTLALPDRAGER